MTLRPQTQPHHKGDKMDDLQVGPCEYEHGSIEAAIFDIYCDTVKQLMGITSERKEDARSKNP